MGGGCIHSGITGTVTSQAGRAAVSMCAAASVPGREQSAVVKVSARKGSRQVPTSLAEPSSPSAAAVLHSRAIRQMAAVVGCMLEGLGECLELITKTIWDPG